MRIACRSRIRKERKHGENEKNMGGRKYYVAKGVFQSTNTGLVKPVKNCLCFVIKLSKKHTNAELVKPVKNGKIYYIKKGVLQSGFSGKIVYNKHTYKIVNDVMTKKVK